MTELGKMLIALGGILVAVGLLVVFAGRTHLPLGRLPGDFLYRGKSTTFYFPLATSILVSIVLTIVLALVSRLRK